MESRATQYEEELKVKEQENKRLKERGVRLEKTVTRHKEAFKEFVARASESQTQTEGLMHQL